MNIIRLPYYSREFNFSQADRTGARVADLDLMKLAHEFGILEWVFIINDDLEPGMAEPTRYEGGCPVIECSSAWLLDNLREDDDYVALISLPDIPKIALWRQHTGKQIPICGVVHAIPKENLFSTYFASAALLQPYDKVLVSSEAGASAVRFYFQRCFEMLRPGTPDSDRVVSDLVKTIPLPVRAVKTGNVDGMREAFGLSPGSVVILYFGRLTAQYKADIEPLIQALLSINTSQEVILIIAGHEVQLGYVSELKKFVNKVGLTHKVRFVLEVPHYAKHLIFSVADIFVAPSDNIQETYGLAVIEAMLTALPVVATNWSGYRDLVIHGETGYLVDIWFDVNEEAFSMIAASAQSFQFERRMAEKTFFDVAQMSRFLKLLVEDLELRKRLGAHGQQRATANFSPQAVIPRLCHVWQEQLNCSKNIKSPKVKAFDFVRAFADFPNASRSLDVCHISRNVLQFRSPGLDETEFTSISAELAGQSIGVIMKEDRESADILTRMLKKGVLLIAESDT